MNTSHACLESVSKNTSVYLEGMATVFEQIRWCSNCGLGTFLSCLTFAIISVWPELLRLHSCLLQALYYWCSWVVCLFDHKVLESGQQTRGNWWACVVSVCGFKMLAIIFHRSVVAIIPYFPSGIAAAQIVGYLLVKVPLPFLGGGGATVLWIRGQKCKSSFHGLKSNLYVSLWTVTLKYPAHITCQAVTLEFIFSINGTGNKVKVDKHCELR